MLVFFLLQQKLQAVRITHISHKQLSALVCRFDILLFFFYNTIF